MITLARLWHRAEIISRPNKLIAFMQHHPGWQIVKAKMPFDGSGQGNSQGGIGRLGMGDRQNRHQCCAVIFALDRQNNDTGPIFAAFIQPAQMLMMPEIGI